INIANLGANLNVRANPCGDVAKVVLTLEGAQNYSRTESKAPYALFGDSNGDYFSWVNNGATPGTYTLTAMPMDSDGDQGDVLSISFTVVDQVVIGNTQPIANSQSVTTPENTAVNITLTGSDADNDPLTYMVVGGPTKGQLSGTAPNLTYTPNQGAIGSDSFTFKVNDGQEDSDLATVSISILSLACENQITELVLYNADTDQPIGPITNNMVIDVAVDGTSLAIVAEACETQFISFSLEYPNGNEYTRSESKAPYSLFGDKGVDLSPIQNLVTGNYIVTAIPFKGGVQGQTVSYQFTVISSSPNLLQGGHNTFDKLDVDNGVEPILTAYPVPFSDELTLRFEHADNGWVEVAIFSTDGRLVQEERYEKTSLWTERVINTEKLAEGVYFLKLRQGSYQEVLKLSKLK
ncbi:MAG: Ig-like domain-containing protein, partial [Bacteroidota bacterium]